MFHLLCIDLHLGFVLVNTKSFTWHELVEVDEFAFNVGATSDDLVGLPRILATVQTLVSFRHPDAIFPLELAHGIASLSSYPSAKILSLFAAGRSS